VKKLEGEDKIDTQVTNNLILSRKILLDIHYAEKKRQK
jgi:hypothetical protein